MQEKIRLCYRLSALILLFGSGLIIAAFIFPAIGCVCSGSGARNLRDAIKRRWLQFFGALINLQVERQGRPAERRAMLAANHVSWLDIIVIGQYLPAYFVAKSDIANWPVIGFLSRQAGTVFIRRGDKKNITVTSDRMAWLFKQNCTIVAFPEGTTTAGNEVLNFHASLFQPALLTKSAIQPVSIQYQGPSKEQAPFIGDETFIGHLIRMLMLDKIEVKLSFLPCIPTAGKNRHWISQETRERIAAELSDERLSDKIGRRA
jgi:1-acyl-sn-glycerol-3-phosphate acyltransferase